MLAEGNDAPGGGPRIGMKTVDDRKNFGRTQKVAGKTSEMCFLTYLLIPHLNLKSDLNFNERFAQKGGRRLWLSMTVTVPFSHGLDLSHSGAVPQFRCTFFLPLRQGS